MKLKEIYAGSNGVFSFEFFPPKNEEGEQKLFESIGLLRELGPSFVTVTYGAMGSTRGNTIRLVSRIKRETGLEVAAHLTSVGHSRRDIEDILGELSRGRIENIVALRGDPPADGTAHPPVPDGFAHASDLVRFIRTHPGYPGKFSLAVAGYPEGHIENPDKQKDLEYLRLKVEQGADVVMTQLFFENRFYFDFVEKARRLGIRVPVVPGIMPVTGASQIEKFSAKCGATIPRKLQGDILRLGGDPGAVEAYGIEYATKQCEDLLRQGAPGIHFYTLNRSRATREIYRNLGLPKGGKRV